MKTEMEQLKENALREQATQTAKDLMAYYVDLLEKWSEAEEESMRSNLLFLFTWIVQLAIIFVPLFIAEDRSEMVKALSDLGSTITWIVLCRHLYYEAVSRRALGEWIGCHNTLVKLGWIDEDDDIGKKVKKLKKATSPFKRFKEFFERLKSKENQEAYA